MTRPGCSLLVLGGSLLLSACPPPGDAGETTIQSTPDASSSGMDSEPTTRGPTTSSASSSTGDSSGGSTSGTSSSGSTSGTSGTSDGSSSDPGADTEESSGGSSGGSTENCGNGEPDPGEGCDEGYAANSDEGSCTLACQPAACGDGHVWLGHENCDEGLNNNDTLYNGCTTQCAPGPTCNDGEVQGPEECDMGGDNGTGKAPDGGVACDYGCRFEAKLVFVTSQDYTGGEIGGVEGADLKCQGLALAAGFDNASAFKAYISDASSSPVSAFVKSTIPYVLASGVRVASDWDELILKGPIPGITLTEKGETLDTRRVWTGTTPSGNKFPEQTCQNWTSIDPDDKGRSGRTNVGADQMQQWLDGKQWVSEFSLDCDFAARLYCVEQ